MSVSLAGAKGFESLTPDAIEVLNRFFTRRILPEGHVFFEQGVRGARAGNTLEVLISGEVEVHNKVQDEGGFGVRRTLRSGAWFGLLSLLDDEERSATCTASTPCEVASLTREDFLALQSSDPVIANQLQLVVARQLASDLRALSARLREAVDGRERRLLESYGVAPE